MDVATKLGIHVTNTPEANANAFAEHVMALILALSKKMIMDKELRKVNFDIRNIVYSEDLEGKTLEIIGLGKIGKLVAEKALGGFRMNVMGYDPYAKHISPTIKQVNSMDTLLQTADFISLHLPLFKYAKHIITTRQFQLMKNSAFFINTTRGGRVDEKALVTALKNNEISGAGIDVFEIEPPNTKEEFFTLNNIIVTQHSAALTKEGSANISLHAAIQIDQVLRGKKPSWPVNIIDGYL